MQVLSSVAPDLHDLLDTSRELNEMLARVPGISRLRATTDPGTTRGPLIHERASRFFNPWLWLAASSGEEVAHAAKEGAGHVQHRDEGEDGQHLPADVQRGAEDVVQGVSHGYSTSPTAIWV
jgi:hypothetical protein